MSDVNNVEQLRLWFRECPAISKHKRFGVDYVSESPTEYAIYAVPSALKYHENILGERMLDDIQTQNFIFASKEPYGQDVLQDPFPVTVTNPTITQMKRILAAPGDRVVLSPYAETRMNGLEIDRSRTSGRTADTVTEVRRVNVENGQYFVQGDQLSLSVDSRDKDFGTVRQNETLGRAEFVLWPIRAFGSLEGQAAGGGQEGAE